MSPDVQTQTDPSVTEDQARETEAAVAAALSALFVYEYTQGALTAAAWYSEVQSRVRDELRALAGTVLSATLRSLFGRSWSGLIPGWGLVATSVVDRTTWSLARAARKVANAAAPSPVSEYTPTKLAISAVTETVARAQTEPFRNTTVVETPTGLQVVRQGAVAPSNAETMQVVKTWRTKRDKRVRPTHGGLEGDLIPVDGSWTTFEGHRLRFPGDPLAPLSETANCRCRQSIAVVSVADTLQRSGAEYDSALAARKRERVA